MTIAKCLTLTGLVLDIIGVLVIGVLAQHWMQQFWKDAPAMFDTRFHKWTYYGAWWAIAIGFVLQALGVLVRELGRKPDDDHRLLRHRGPVQAEGEVSGSTRGIQ